MRSQSGDDICNISRDEFAQLPPDKQKLVIEALRKRKEDQVSSNSPSGSVAEDEIGAAEADNQSAAEEEATKGTTKEEAAELKAARVAAAEEAVRD